MKTITWDDVVRAGRFAVEINPLVDEQAFARLPDGRIYFIDLVKGQVREAGEVEVAGRTGEDASNWHHAEGCTCGYHRGPDGAAKPARAESGVYTREHVEFLIGSSFSTTEASGLMEFVEALEAERDEALRGHDVTS